MAPRPHTARRITVTGLLAGALVGGALATTSAGARVGDLVTGYQESAVADARINLADLDARIVAAEVARWRPQAADVVVADPSRSGLGRPGVGAITATGAPRLVLVSCDPASLARDTVLLRAAGYHLVSVALVDAFPHTFHTETVSRFDRITT